MKRPRPHIPLAVRLKVVRRMLDERGLELAVEGKATKWMIELGLSYLHLQNGQLDHDPALILREFNPRTMKYTPDANDPDHLVYRAADEHQQKTTGRKPGASHTVTTKGSDIGLKAKFARLEKPKKPRTTISPRGFSKGPSRPWPKRSMGQK